jgi:hypothetical protein
LERPYTIDIVIALAKGERLSKAWWLQRYRRGAVRAGGMPPEVADPLLATLRREVDLETGDRYGRVALPVPAGTSLCRARELAHMLSSVLAGEGYTLRAAGTPVETLPGEYAGQPAGTFGGAGFSEGRVCSDRCWACVKASESHPGCCSEGAAFSLADIGAALRDGDEEFVTSVLALPGEMDGVKWQPYLVGGRCRFHTDAVGCTLPPSRMPLQCRTYLCAPEQLLPPAMLAEYEAYVEALEEQEAFVEEHMRKEGGVDFTSPPRELKVAAVRAFAALEAADRDRR